LGLNNVHLLPLHIWNAIPASKINSASLHRYKTPTQLKKLIEMPC
jgi:hypothetical protein